MGATGTVLAAMCQHIMRNSSTVHVPWSFESSNWLTYEGIRKCRICSSLLFSLKEIYANSNQLIFLRQACATQGRQLQAKAEVPNIEPGFAHSSAGTAM